MTIEEIRENKPEGAIWFAIDIVFKTVNYYRTCGGGWLIFKDGLWRFIDFTQVLSIRDDLRRLD